ncbi:Heat shock 70 kDa protein [Rhynchospora pubera]|uniref:Heat shock 70 kDa protein n=1 Tax=Rhynchospora pubera TaxID=906938 RepID=A0AAV8DRE3_9POAL|nr:Heat shock 70 kDa protein [Rhynchospora pubera]
MELEGRGSSSTSRMGPAIGIDLGTAYTRAALFDGNQCRMIPDDQGRSAMPSYVAFTDSSGVLVGEAAKKQAMHNRTNTVFDVIRLIGRRYSDPSVRNDMRLWPFKVIGCSQTDRLLVEVRWKGKLWMFNPVEICSMILTKIKENAETNLRATITDAVITVPVHFNYEQRQAIKEASVMAGLNLEQIISAPAASSLFYSTVLRLSGNSSKPEEYNLIIFDLGAGTLDISLITIKGDVCEVRATAGNVHLGGSDFDNKLIYHFVNLLGRKGHTDIGDNVRAVSVHRTVFEGAKVALSSESNTVSVMIGPLYNDVKYKYSINTETFNELNKELFIKCVDAIKTCLRDAKMTASMVDEVILGGGSTRIPLLQVRINQFFKRKLKVTDHLETAVAYGAALQASFFSTRGYGQVHCLNLLNATSFSLGIQLSRGIMAVCIPKNTTIPTRKERIFHSYRSNKTKILVQVYEGEGRSTSENNLLGKLELSGSPTFPNECELKVCFEVDVNGTLTVTAEESSTGISNNITLTANNIEYSQRGVWEAGIYEESEKVSNKASMTMGSTEIATPNKWNQMREKPELSRLLTLERLKSEKIMGQSSRRHVEPDEYAIGIDFGTTYSCVAVWRRNGVKIIENEYGSRATCSCVAFTDTGRLIGDTVNKEQVMTNPANAITNIKRLIGRCWSDQSVKNNKCFRPFSVVRGNNNKGMVSVLYKGQDEHFAPEEIAAMILSKMKEIAEAHLSSKVTKAVISVPACFSDSQRKAIKDAGVVAGLNVLQLLNEPTAATIAYYLQKKTGAESSDKKTFLIFDLGGGNLDVSIVKINEGNIKVQAVVGDTNLGGEDFDNNMVHHFVEKFRKEKNRDISSKPRSLRRLRAACEKAKRVLSTNAQTVVEVDALDEGIDFHSAITREDFEELNRSLFNRSIDCVARCLEDAKMDRKCIDEVVLVGGSTRIPKVKQLLQEFFNGKELCKSVNADEAVAYGAAVQAAILSGNEDCEKFNILKLQDITSLSFGLESKDGKIMNVLIPKHTSVPAKKELLIMPCADELSSLSIEVQECELASMTAFNLSGITPKPRGDLKINLCFEVDGNGILNLTANDMSTGQKNEIVVSKQNDGLTAKEIETMVEAADRYKAEDEEHKARAAALNSLENFAYRIKAIARDPAVSASDKKLMEEAADQALAWSDTNHHAGIEEISVLKRHLETIKNQIALVSP